MKLRATIDSRQKRDIDGAARRERVKERKAKRKLDHGQWLPWLETEFGWSDETARKMMQVYDLVKSQQNWNLQIDISALYLIAAPKTPSSVRVELVTRMEAGEKITRAKALDVLNDYKAPATRIRRLLWQASACHRDGHSGGR